MGMPKFEVKTLEKEPFNKIAEWEVVTSKKNGRMKQTQAHAKSHE